MEKIKGLITNMQTKLKELESLVSEDLAALSLVEELSELFIKHYDEFKNSLTLIEKELNAVLTKLENKRKERDKLIG